MKDFIKALSNLDDNVLDNITKKAIIQSDNTYNLKPIIPIELIGYDDGEKHKEYFGNSLGVNFTNIDNAFDHLFNDIKNNFDFLSRLILQASKDYKEDNSIPKLADVYFSFNTDGIGEDINIFMSTTCVEPINEKEVEMNKTPMSDYDKTSYFSYPSNNKLKAEHDISIKDEIECVLDRINSRIKKLYDREDVINYPACKDYLDKKINGILIPVIVTIRLQPFSLFGDGLSNDDLMVAETVNAKAVSEVIDNEITNIINHLKSIPKTKEEIDHYALEVDGLGIYGCNILNQPIETMINQEYMFANCFQNKYSQGFFKCLVEYMKTIKNEYFFTSNGKIIESLKEDGLDKEKYTEELIDSYFKNGVDNKTLYALKKYLTEDETISKELIDSLDNTLQIEDKEFEDKVKTTLKRIIKERIDHHNDSKEAKDESLETIEVINEI